MAQLLEVERLIAKRETGTKTPPGQSLSEANEKFTPPADRIPPRAAPYALVPEYKGGCTLKIEGHDEWVESATHHIGFTTAWAPNKVIRGGPAGEYADLDITSKREKTGGPTFAAVTSRSYHPGGVESQSGDGSVRFFNSSINGQTWRLLGSVGGGEVIAADS